MRRGAVRKGLIILLCGDVGEHFSDGFMGENAGKFVSSTMSEMVGEDDLELELESEMVSVHRANLGGRGGGEEAWGPPTPRDSLERDWQCFSIINVSPSSVCVWRAALLLAPGSTSY